MMAVKVKFIFLLLLILSLMILPVSAHPGRTDDSGGHFDSSTGEYHYHHGHSAHQHIDLDGDGTLDCPYFESVSVNERPAASVLSKIWPVIKNVFLFIFVAADFIFAMYWLLSHFLKNK